MNVTYFKKNIFCQSAVTNLYMRNHCVTLGNRHLTVLAINNRSCRYLLIAITFLLKNCVNNYRT